MTNTILKGIAYHHAAIKAKDFERSLRFYQKLGAVVDFEWGTGTDRKCMLDLGGGVRLELFADGGDDYVPNGRIAHLALAVADVQQAYRAALEAGAVTVKEPQVMHLPSTPRKVSLCVAFVQGPDGEEIEFCKQVIPTI